MSRAVLLPESPRGFARRDSGLFVPMARRDRGSRRPPARRFRVPPGIFGLGYGIDGGYGYGGVAGGGSGGFNPGSVGGLEIDLDFTDITQLFQDSGLTTPVTANLDPIGGCKDKSGNARHATQATSSKRALYKTNQFPSGASGVEGDNVDDELRTGAFTISQPNVVFVAVDSDNAGANENVSDGVTNRQEVGKTSGSVWLGNAGVSLQFGTVNTNPHVLCIRFNGASSKAWQDGGAGTTGDTSTSGLSGGLIVLNNQAGARPWDGRLARFLLYSGSLSNANIDYVGGGLAALIGTTWTPVS